MSNHHHAIGLAFLASLLLSSSVQGEQHTDRPNSYGAKSATQKPSDAVLGAKPTAYDYSYSCEKPKSAEQENLCIQRRAADAAVEAVVWARASAWVGIAGTVAVVLTLAGSVWTNMMMRRDYASSNRPRIRFISATIENWTENKPIKIAAKIGNVGGTKAIIKSMHFDLFSCVGDGPGMKPEVKLKPVKKLKLGASQQIDFTATCAFIPTQDEIRGILAGEMRLFLSGLVCYADTTGVVRTTSILREYCHKTQRIQEKASEDHDYEI